MATVTGYNTGSYSCTGLINLKADEVTATSISCDTFLNQSSSLFTGISSNIQTQIDYINTLVNLGYIQLNNNYPIPFQIRDSSSNILFKIDNSGNIYGKSLYINNGLINFDSYVTSSYLSSQLSNYATISYVNSQLSNYATNSALSSYRLISDSYAKWEIDDKFSSYRLISDSYAKWEVDNMVAGLSAGIAANGVAVAGVVVALAATDAAVAANSAEIATLQGEVSTLQGDVSTLDGQVSALQTKTQNQTATASVTNFSGSVNTTTLSATTLGATTGSHTLNIGNNLYGGILTDNINIGTGLAFNNVNILGVLYINGVPFVPFNVSAPMAQWT